MSAPSLSLESLIEKQMMEFGSGIITDLDRFTMTPLSECDLDGNVLDFDDTGDLMRFRRW